MILLVCDRHDQECSLNMAAVTVCAVYIRLMNTQLKISVDM